jgi:cytosine/adenosine deaminase-related metal-dependent hydrolase
MSVTESPVRHFSPLVKGESPSWLLRGGWVALNAFVTVPADLKIVSGQIFSLTRREESGNEHREPTPDDRCMEIPIHDCLVLPGLINSHDHLEFNLFPRLGRGPYPNFEKWADDIFHPQKPPVREHLSVPKRTRLWWGALKNLLSGVTTVCHHNPYDANVFEDDFPVRVVKRYGWAHSMRFAPNVAEAFRATPPNGPFIIHLGEGTDRRSGNEIFELDRCGALDSRTVLVHAVGINAQGHMLRRSRDAAVVWCPSSNRFTLGITLNPATMNECDRISLGSDSALTADGDLLDEVRAAQREGVDPNRIYSMVTDSAADVLRLSNGEGGLREGGAADLFVVRWNRKTPAETLIETRLETIEIVMVGGQPNLVSSRSANSVPRDVISDLEEIEIDGTRCRVRAPVERLLKETQKLLGPDVRLAGKRVKL